MESTGSSLWTQKEYAKSVLRINLKLDPILGAHIVKFFCAAIEREISSEYSIHNEVHAIILYSLLCISNMINSRNIFFLSRKQIFKFKA